MRSNAIYGQWCRATSLLISNITLMREKEKRKCYISYINDSKGQIVFWIQGDCELVFALFYFNWFEIKLEDNVIEAYNLYLETSTFFTTSSFRHFNNILTPEGMWYPDRSKSWDKYLDRNGATGYSLSN